MKLNTNKNNKKHKILQLLNGRGKFLDGVLNLIKSDITESQQKSHEDNG